MNENPKEKINTDVVQEMGAERFSHPDPKGLWDSITSGATHKIGACMDAMKGKVDDTGAFCNWLADQNGYKPQ